MHTAIAKNLLQPIVRVSLASTIKPSFSRLFRTNIHGSGASQTLLNALKLKLHRNVSNPYRDLIFTKSHHFPARIFCISGGKLAVNTVLGLSVVIGSWTHIAHCTDGFDFLADDRSYSVSGYPESDGDEDHRILGKILLPAFLLVTVLMNWGQPIVIAAKLILILYGSKPSPFSIYFVIEQLQKQAMHKRPIFFRYTVNSITQFMSKVQLTNLQCYTWLMNLAMYLNHISPLPFDQQSCYAKKVEVEDYVFFCFARAELDDQNLSLVGILGSWWVLPLAS